jgi:hypothetical protein
MLQTQLSNENQKVEARGPWRTPGVEANLQLLQFREIHAQTFLAKLTTELDLHELGIFLHLAFEDRTLTKLIVEHPVAGLELLPLWFRRGRRSRRRYIATALLRRQ